MQLRHRSGAVIGTLIMMIFVRGFTLVLVRIKVGHSFTGSYWQLPRCGGFGRLASRKAFLSAGAKQSNTNCVVRRKVHPIPAPFLAFLAFLEFLEPRP